MGVRIDHNKWTDERKVLLREIFHEGTHGWLAQELNERTGSTFTKNAIIGRCHREGLRWTKEDKERIALPLGRPRARANDDRGTTQRLRRKVRSFVVQAEIIPVNAPEHLGLTLLQLDGAVCKYPRGEEQFTFCGQPAQEASSYCSFHHQLCYSPPDRRPTNSFRRAA